MKRAIRLSVALGLSAVVIMSIVAVRPADAAPPDATVLLSGLSSPKGLAFHGDGVIVGQGAFGPPGPVLRYAVRGPDEGTTSLLTEPISLVDVAVSPLDDTIWAIGADNVLYHRLADGTIVPVLNFPDYQDGDPDPVDTEADDTESRPYGLEVLPNGDALVADAAGNDVIRATPAGDAWTVARFDVEAVETDHLDPQPLPDEVDAEAVPTSIGMGPEGEVYVGELKGFPYRPGSSRIWRIDPDVTDALCSAEGSTGGCAEHASGFTAIQDLAFVPGSAEYYVYELAEGGVIPFEDAFDSGDFPPAVLLHVTATQTRESLAGQLSEPGGVVVDGGVVYVTDGVLSDGRLLTAEAPTISGTPPSGVVGTPYSFTFTTTGDPTPTVTLDSGTVPLGLTLGSDGSLTGTPTKPGTSRFTVKASNGVDPDATLEATIVVRKAPRISGTPPSGGVGEPYSFTFTKSGFPAPTVTKASGTIPPGLSLSSSGVLSGTPTQAGTFTFRVRASNGVSPDRTRQVTVVIQPRPSIRIADASIAEGDSGTRPIAFRVTLSRASTVPITVRVTTADSSAKGGSDFVNLSTTVTFAPGQTSKFVAVQVKGDQVKEPNEVFVVALFNATRAVIADPNGTGVIRNDD